jgi:O-antigen/teichoic acid export membrane protein
VSHVPANTAESPVAPPAPSGRARAVSGAAWTSLAQLIGQPLRMVSNAVLAHLVPTAAFGTMQIVGALNQGINSFSDLGVSTAIVKRKEEPSEAFLATAWTMQVIRGCVISLIGMLLSVPLALLYQDPQNPWQSLLPIFLASTATLALSGFTSLNNPLAVRHLKLKLCSIFDLSAQVLGLAAGIAIAYFTRNVWALVLGNVATSLARVVLSYIMFPGPMMRFHTDPASRKELLGFARWILISTILTFAAAQADRFIFPKLVNSLELTALFGLAMSFGLVPQDIVNRIAYAVLMPALSRARDTHEIPAAQYRDANIVILLVTGLMTASLAAIVPGFITLAYPANFHPAIALMPWVALLSWFRVLQSTGTSVLLALDLPKEVVKSNIVKLIALLICMPAGFYIARHFFGTADPLPAMLGAVAGLLLSDMIKQGVIMLSLRKAGLHGIRREAAFTGYLLVAIAAGLVLHAVCVRQQWHPLVEMSLAGFAVLIIYSAGFAAAWKLVGPHLPFFKRFAKATK